MQKEVLIKLQDVFTHEQYRSVGVAHLLNIDQEYEFYYQGKRISKEWADEMVMGHHKGKNAEFNHLISEETDT